METQPHTSEDPEFYSGDFGPVTDVIWDGDNTIWDWMRYAPGAYEAMAQVIADETDKPEPEVAAAMKKFYTKAGTIEDDRLIQGLTKDGFFDGIKGFNRDRLIQKAQEAFKEERNNNLHVYPGAYKAFKTIHVYGINNRILTDAPSRQAKMRIKRSRLSPFLKQVNALPSNNDPDLPPFIIDREKAGEYDVDFEITEVPWEKPYSNLEEILHMTRDQIRRQIVIIGDNDKKDMELVRIYGCRGIHAVYGETTPELLKRLLRFSPERVAKKNASVRNGQESGSREHQGEGLIVQAKSPADILKYLGIGQKKKR